MLTIFQSFDDEDKMNIFLSTEKVLQRPDG